MNIDNQIIYIVILLFTCIVLLCIALIYLYINILNKYAKIKDDPIIGNAEKIAKKIIETTKDLDQRREQIMNKTIDQIISKWSEVAETILTKNTKLLDEKLQKSVENIYKSEISNLDLYKKEKIKEFNNLLSEQIEKISRNIIKKEINLEDHKKLIVEGLERAKNSGLFK